MSRSTIPTPHLDHLSQQPVSPTRDRHRDIEPQNHRDTDPHDPQSRRAHDLDPGLPLAEYVVRAEQLALAEGRDGSRWRSRTWRFTRLLKAHAVVGSRTALEMDQMVDWSRTSWSEVDRLAILAEWDQVQFPAGVEPLELAAKLAEEQPLREGGDHPLYGRFVSVAGWLQKLRGNRDILLPCRKVAPLLGVEKDAVTNLRRLAVGEGLLEVVKPHDFKKGRATQFRFNVDAFPQLGEGTENTNENEC